MQVSLLLADNNLKLIRCSVSLVMVFKEKKLNNGTSIVISVSNPAIPQLIFLQDRNRNPDQTS